MTVPRMLSYDEVYPSERVQAKSADGAAGNHASGRNAEERMDHGTELIWGRASPLPTRRDIAPFCSDVLGEVAKAFADAVALETATPPDFAGIGVLGVVSTVTSGAVLVEAHQGWREPTNLYLLALAEPGEGKTPVMKRVARPLDVIERDRQSQVRPMIVDAEARKNVADARRKRLEAIAARCAPQERYAAEAEALDAAQEAAAIEIPDLPRVYTREATPEALVLRLGQQRGRLGVVSDEGSEFFEMASRYAAAGKGNLGIYIDGWDGKRHVTDRVGREPIVIDRVTLTVCLFGQPVVLEELRRDRQAMGRGLLARFLWSTPASLVGMRPIHRPSVTDQLESQWEQLVGDLARQAYAITDPVVLRLDLDAKHLFDEWRGDHEPRLLAGEGDLAEVVDWANKLPGEVLRLCGNLHALRTGQLSGVIDAGTMVASLELADYFTSHSQAVFKKMTVDPGVDDALEIARWFCDRHRHEFGTREVATSKDWVVERTKSAIGVLAEYGWIRQAPRREGPGRPSERWAVHPNLMEQIGAIPTLMARGPRS